MNPRVPVAPVGSRLSVLIFIMPAKPGHRCWQISLIPSLGCQIHEVIGSVNHVHAALVTGIGMEDLSVRVFVKRTEADHFSGAGPLLPVIPEGGSVRDFFRRKRRVEIKT